MAHRLSVIVTAAGSSNRFREGRADKVKKEFADIDGHSVLHRACFPFINRNDVVALFVTYRKDTEEETRRALGNFAVHREIPVFFIEGGATRQESVFNALSALNGMNGRLKSDFVCIHDGARPFVSEKIISDTAEAAFKTGGAVPVLKITDTIVQLDTDGFVNRTLDRNGVCRVQTPQVFSFPDIYEAHKKALVKSDKIYTDDSQIFGAFGGKVATVEGSESNIKVTYAKDLK